MFDGVNLVLSGATNVLVENNLIREISTDASAAAAATVIDGGGRVLMPGMADTHTYIMFASLPQLM